jgi:hypothetical protein
MSVYMGIDWSQKKHDLAIVDEGGEGHRANGNSPSKEWIQTTG